MRLAVWWDHPAAGCREHRKVGKYTSRRFWRGCRVMDTEQQHRQPLRREPDAGFLRLPH